jgi:hypothetical protein
MRCVGRPTIGDEPRKLIAIRLVWVTAPKFFQYVVQKDSEIAPPRR